MASDLTVRYFCIQKSSCCMAARCTGPVAAKQIQILTLPPPVLGSWYQVLVLTCCFFKKHLHLDWAINGHHLLFIIMPEHVVIVTCSCVMWLSPFMLDLSANSEVSDSECFECFCTLNCRNAGVTLVHAGSDHSAADVRDRHQSAV